MLPARSLRQYNDSDPRKRNFLLPVAALWGLVLAAGFAFIVFDDGVSGTFGEYYLIPWSLGAGAVFVSPSLYLLYKGKFDLFHPLVYCVWSYILPVFAIGGILITFDLTNPYVMGLVEDPEYFLPFSLILVVLGFIGVIIGFSLPLGEMVVRSLERFSPKAEWDPASLWFGGLLLVLFGLGIDVFGFVQGIFGFQRVTEVGDLDGLVSFLAIVFNIGFVLLWLAFFKSDKKGPFFYLVILLLLALIPIKMGLQGGRSSLMLSVLSIGAAYWYSGRRLRATHTAIFGVIVFLSVLIGIIYGTSFRRIKGSEERMVAGDYVGQVFQTLDYISTADMGYILSDGFTALAERVENLSSLGVVVSNHEKLEPFEESYGLKDNIYNDVVTAFIPRFVWPDKPNTSDARAYSDLYFKYGDNSFAITPFGDLYRNFGLFGVPLGMMIFGIYYRLIYSYLIATPEPRVWKSAAYYPLLTVVSYESFYATFLPISIRVIAIVVVSMIIVSFFVRKVTVPR